MIVALLFGMLGAILFLLAEYIWHGRLGLSEVLLGISGIILGPVWFVIGLVLFSASADTFIGGRK